MAMANYYYLIGKMMVVVPFVDGHGVVDGAGIVVVVFRFGADAVVADDGGEAALQRLLDSPAKQ
jgi:chromosome condensin MukBEF MukE localization factor